MCARAPEMLRQAQRRTCEAGGRADLRLGTASRLDWPDATFDAAITVNNVQLWQLPRDLEEIRRVLRPDGLLSITVHTWLAM